MSKGQVLVLGSNATQLGLRSGSTATVGQYLNETAVPALALLDAGYDIVLARPTGPSRTSTPVPTRRTTLAVMRLHTSAPRTSSSATRP